MESVNLVYFSASGTTKVIVSTLCEGLGSRGKVEYDLLRKPPKKPVTFAANTPAVFAVPVYAGRVPSVCADILKKFQGAGTPAAAIVVYGNRDYDDALLELTDIIKANGFIVVTAAAFVAQHSIFPRAAAGRPDDRDKEVVKFFAEKCKKAFLEFDVKESKENREKIVVKGSSPYREPSVFPLKPSGSSKCDSCGVCVDICPVKAIMSGNPRVTDKTRCIPCAACIAECPRSARAFHGFLYALAGRNFTKRCGARKEPDLFF